MYAMLRGKPNASVFLFNYSNKVITRTRANPYCEKVQLSCTFAPSLKIEKKATCQILTLPKSFAFTIHPSDDLTKCTSNAPTCGKLVPEKLDN